MSKKKPILSFVIPVYNVEEYIGATIESCLEQDISHDEYEIVCIDDGSQDNSLRIIKEYQGKFNNIQCYSKQNGGVSSARNKGLELATGEYIWFVDGDDIVASNCLKSVIEKLKKSSADIFWFKVINFIRDVPASNNRIDVAMCNKRSELYDFMFSKGGVGVWSNIYKAELLKDNSILFVEDIAYSEDVLFNFEVLLKAKICMKTDAILYFYRQRDGSAMHSGNIKKHMQSMFLLAEKYNSLATKEQDVAWGKIIQNKRHFAVKALCFDLVQQGDMGVAEEKLNLLKQKKFYPYPFLTGCLKGNLTKKQMLINYLSFLFPIECYLKLCIFICGKVGSRRKKR